MSESVGKITGVTEGWDDAALLEKVTHCQCVGYTPIIAIVG